MKHPTARLGTTGLVIALALLTGCTDGSTPPPDGAAPQASSGPQPVITTDDAKQVFARYDRENAAADAALDDVAASKIQTGVLLKESLAGYEIHRKAGTEDEAAHLARPRFLIPTEEAGAPYPRSFAVLSKWKGSEKDRSSSLLYFTQAEKGGAWKADAAGWAVTEPAKTSASASPTPSPAPSKKDDTAVRVQPKVLPDIRRSPSGTAQLSDTSQADREVCDSYADYLSFTSPLGSPTDDRFAEGGFTSDLVRFYNDWADSGLGHTFSYRVTGAGLPVFRLSTGSSLVACTLVQEHRTTGAPPTGTVRYDKGSDTDLLLGGGGRQWRSVDQTSSLTALIEVPTQKTRAATVLACDCYDPQLLSVTGARSG
ncbi:MULTISPECIES: hypothetical protein [unclassified Streptomyces]|uniref:DUF8094 domain-containing protein n=1 Tax=Streptomyces sp. gb1(2016) TaxID=1828321 RepID=A0A652L6W2_9ACTN|nr:MULTISPECIES: hypothetical protein [unclassified Streptomyces]MDX3685818.1 hypothetical protein [Streptomyces sp. AK04-4c]TXS31802.1 hypothetical protein EAO74_08615 [Streptomyces sp. gb1(2016)]